MGLYLGIDTSNYSTSAAIYDSDNKEMRMFRKLLPVPEGQVGLRQSDAVFAHIKQLPLVIEDLKVSGKDGNLTALGVSVFPRRVDGSYMPCFLVGKATAECIATVLERPLFSFSHQEGHVMAALYSSGSLELLDRPFLAFHVSGGTTEALLVTPDRETVIRAKCIARTLDLNAGQLIDRVGKLLGCGFPAGPELEKLAEMWQQPVRTRAVLKGNDICLSGVQNQCEALLNEGAEASQVARFCLESIREALEKMLSQLIKEHGTMPILFSGGVMSNRILKSELSKLGDCRFAEPAYSADNAAGIAYLAYLKEHGR